MDATDLRIFLARFEQPAVTDAISARGHLDARDVERRLAVYRNEVFVGLDLLSDSIRPGQRILEIGAGLGMLSLYLRVKGHDVTALEPNGAGFDFFEAAAPVMQAAVPEVELPLLRIAAEDLDPAVHGLFDLVFSVNVLEHVRDLAAVFRGMTSVLSQRGTMVHLCPNYAVPYEPHFARPLLPFFPRLSRCMMGRAGALPGVWESLNFITYRRVGQLARQNELDVSFDTGLVAKALTRLDDDKEYAGRHKLAAIRAIARLAKFRAFGALLGRLPAGLATPMQFRLSRRL